MPHRGAGTVADVRSERARVARVVRQHLKPLRWDAELARDVLQLCDIA